MQVLRLSREDRAYQIIKLCELAARGLIPDLDDSDDSSIALLQGSYQKLTSKVTYLLARSSAQWKPAFEKVLDASHSIRIQKIDAGKKEARRDFIGTCMACGKKEKNCRYSIDLAGSLNSKAWLQDPLNVHQEYRKFKEEYEAVYEDTFVETNTREGQLPAIDKGCYILGETCLRKAKLRYALQTLLLETSYTAERDIEELTKGSDTDLRRDTIYVAFKERCQELVNTQDTIELAIADEKRPAPDVACDDEFWDILDECRNIVSGGNEGVFNDLIRQRAYDAMHSLLPKDNAHQNDGDEADFSSLCDDKEEENEAREEAAHQPKRRRCVIEDEEDESDMVSKRAIRVMTNVRCEPSSSVAVDGCASVEIGAAEHDDDERSSLKPMSRRQAPESISGIVGKQRASGSLPSRREAVLQLMNLQIKLQREDRSRDSSVCTNAILTLQELINRVEELRHTV